MIIPTYIDYRWAMDVRWCLCKHADSNNIVASKSVQVSVQN